MTRLNSFETCTPPICLPLPWDGYACERQFTLDKGAFDADADEPNRSPDAAQTQGPSSQPDSLTHILCEILKDTELIPLNGELARIQTTRIFRNTSMSYFTSQALSPGCPTAILSYRAGPGRFFCSTGQASAHSLNEAGTPGKPHTQL
ncbi:hypothetical protein Y032_0117g672 [Ancylostoma ceylanicum]|uniref:Uncharacterized protein n=1 Tax=Ancylostoma ceylanicum TaxID=53326 RepID=A0A016TC04_9BILA|nr:hypothetical protein Y032_0117g672 [Ancylostoma ceylanicum]